MGQKEDHVSQEELRPFVRALMYFFATPGTHRFYHLFNVKKFHDV